MFEKPNESSGNVIGYKAIGTLTGAGMGVVDYRSRGSRATLRDGLWTTLKWLVVGMILLSAIPPTAQAELDVPSTVFHEGNDVVGNVVIAAASCNQTDVQAAINSAVSGDTVLVPAGECTWTSGIGFSGKKITLIGAGIDSTVINRSSFGTVINMGQTASRVTGFTFNEGGILVDGDGWRIDHCKIYSASFSNGVLVRGTRSSAAHPTGLIDNCFFHNARVNVQGTAAMLHENDWQHILWTNSLDLGTNNNVVYVEDCNFELDVFGNAIDTNYGGAYVFRFNHLSHVYVELHSVQSNNRATRRWEIYGNTLDNPGGSIYFPYRIRAGTGVIFNETLVGTWTNYGIALDNVRSYAPRGDGGQCDGTSTWDGNEDATGYPCRDQIGRGPDNPQWNHILPAPAYTQPLIPAYGWGNRRQSNNALVPFQVINSGGNHIKPNRDYYEETPTFDGTTGVGVGVLADRPATCATGVGYWATDQGSWNANGDDGVLYKCTSTDTWELYYIPYPYPHPLRGEGDTTPPANITDLSVSYCTSDSIKLTWTASGDDENTGTATAYDIRYSTSNITDDNWDSATEADGEPTPNITGSSESFIITGLTSETPYYFAIKTSDEVPLESGLSNVLNETTHETATIHVGSCEQVDVQAAIDSANSGDAVVVPAGECEWTSAISITKSITLQGAGMSETIITASSATLISSSANDAVIAGFYFKAPSSANYIIVIKGDGWRIHHNKLECTENPKICGVYARGANGRYNPTGLIDNNIFIDAQAVSIGSAGLLTAGDSQNEIYAEALDLGGSSAVYIEDNIFTTTVGGNVIDANYASSYVARFNTITMPGWGNHIESHSMQSPANRANRKWEIYGNTLIGVEKYVPFFIRGGTGVIFNNELEGSFSNEKIYFDNVRTYRNVGGTAGRCNGSSLWDGNQDATGWPCRDQIGTGSDLVQWENDPPSEYTQTSVPAYIWSNLDTGGGEITVSVINGCTQHIKPNRDYYEETPTFDGTTGVGVGVLADRPATCATGVGYWATDQGSWNANGDDGVLYKCTSTDIWELYYTPYYYPHPLRDTGASPTFTISDGTSLIPVSSDTINITAEDETSLNENSLEYGFSSDNTCNASDTYGNSFTNSVDFTIFTTHTDYLCVKAADTAGNIGYQLVGKLNVNCDICVNTTGWWRDNAAFDVSSTPVQHAIDNATEGDTICVNDGTYTENVDVNKRLTIRSKNGSASTTVQAASTSDHVFNVTADYVNVTGFNVTGATGSGKAGIYLSSGVNHCNISDNSASNCNRSIYLNYSSDNMLTGNNASNGNYGVYLTSSNNNQIYDNYFNNTENARDDGTNIWNTTRTTGPNIIGGPYIGGNYWSDYPGVDGDGDGFGDTAHDIPGGSNQDRLPLVPICGDVDGSGNVNILDVRLLLNHVNDPGNYPVNPYAGNVNGEGGIDMADVRLLLAYVFDPEANPLSCSR